MDACCAQGCSFFPWGQAALHRAQADGMGGLLSSSNSDFPLASGSWVSAHQPVN